MPFENIFQESDGKVITVYSGVVTDEEFIQCLNEKLIPIEKVKTYRCMITDCTDVTEFKISADVMKEYAVLATAGFAANPDVFFIAIMPSDLEFGLGRMWQAYADETNQRSHLVRTRKEADDYLLEKFGE